MESGEKKAAGEADGCEGEGGEGVDGEGMVVRGEGRGRGRRGEVGGEREGGEGVGGEGKRSTAILYLPYISPISP